MKRSRAGGILSGLMATFAVVVCAAVLFAYFVAHSVRVRHEDTANGGKVEVETPFGRVSVDARDKLDPQTVGIPVYPGAERENGRDGGALGGALIDLDWTGDTHRQLSIVTAKYYTADSPDKVRDFYHARLPHWIFEQRRNGTSKIEYSEQGYKRVILIHERRDRTEIAIASIGDPPAN